MENHILIRVIADELRETEKKPLSPDNSQKAKRLKRILNDLLAS